MASKPNYLVRSAIRLNPDGSLDPAFSGGVVAESVVSAADGLLIRASGAITVIGSVRVRGLEEGAIWQYNSDGTSDTSFTPSGRFSQSDALLPIYEGTRWRRAYEQIDGSLVVAGNFTRATFPAGNTIGLWVLTADGRSLSAFNRGERRLELNRLALAEGFDRVEDMIEFEGRPLLVGASEDPSMTLQSAATAIESSCTTPAVNAIYAVPAPGDGSTSFIGDDARAGTAADPTSLREGLARVQATGGELRLVSGTYRLSSTDPSIDVDLVPNTATVRTVEIVGGYSSPSGDRDAANPTLISDDRSSGATTFVLSGTSTQTIAFDGVEFRSGDLANSRSIEVGVNDTRVVVSRGAFELRGSSFQGYGINHERNNGSVAVVDSLFDFPTGLAPANATLVGVNVNSATELYVARNAFSGRGRPGISSGQTVIAVRTGFATTEPVWIRDNVIQLGAGGTTPQTNDAAYGAQLGGNAVFMNNRVELQGAHTQTGVLTQSIQGDRLIVGNTFAPLEGPIFRQDAILARGTDGAFGVTHVVRNNVIVLSSAGSLSNGLRAETGGSTLQVQNNSFVNLNNNGFALKLGVNSGTAAPIRTTIDNNLFVQPVAANTNYAIDSRGASGIRSEIQTLRNNTFFNAEFVLNADDNPNLDGTGCIDTDAVTDRCSIAEINALGADFVANEDADPVLDVDYRPTVGSPCTVVSGAFDLSPDLNRDRDNARRTTDVPVLAPGTSRGAFEFDLGCIP
ncbi:MAG: hypothetical protein AAF654_00480 [Myxococcota bacterium]